MYIQVTLETRNRIRSLQAQSGKEGDDTVQKIVMLLLHERLKMPQLDICHSASNSPGDALST